MCIKKTIENCEEYEGTDGEFCSSIKLRGYYYNCVLKNNKCVKQFNDCVSYNIESKVINKVTCQSIVLKGAKRKCVFNNETDYCETEYKTCSEHTGTKKEECESCT